MTNRFTGEFDKQYSGVHDNGEQLTNFEVVDLLNNLSEDNEKLKSKNRGLQSELQIFKEDVTHSTLQINKLADENEQLKSTINTLTYDNTKMKKVLNTTKNENEQIKQVIKEAYNNERTHIGKNTLKQLMEAIQ